MSFLSDSDTTTITVSGTPVQAVCGPVLRGVSEYDGGIKYSRKIIADEGDIPVSVGQSVDIDGDTWEVLGSVIFDSIVSVTFIRLGG